MCTSSVSNVIYHKFSHCATFYTLNGKHVNVRLEFQLAHDDVMKLYLRHMSAGMQSFAPGIQLPVAFYNNSELRFSISS